MRRTWAGRRDLIHDSARGALEITEAELSKHWTGVVLEWRPTAALAKTGKPVRLRLTQLGITIDGFQSALLQAIGLSLLLQLIAFAAPFFLQLSIDKAVPAFDTAFLLALALGFAALELVAFATRGLREIILVKLSSAVGFSLVTDLLRHLLALDREGVDAATQAAQQARRQDELGLIDFFVLLSAEQSLLIQRDQLVAVQADDALAIADLYAALGDRGTVKCPTRSRHALDESTLGQRRYRISGGDGGIRTLGTLIEYGSLAGNWFQPLTHVSAAQGYAKRAL